MNTSKILRKAADHIQRRDYWDGHVRDCATHNAVWAVCEVTPHGYGCADACQQFILHMGFSDKDRTDFFDWNDETPGEIVVKEMRACAEALDEVTS